MPVLDTNIFIRHFTNDVPEMAARALAVLQRIEAGDLEAYLPEGVLVEVVQVLSGKNYTTARDDIRNGLGEIISMPHIQMSNKRTYLNALDIYVRYSRLDFADALCIAHGQRMGDPTVISFDRGFRNLPEVTWVEP